MGQFDGSIRIAKKTKKKNFRCHMSQFIITCKEAVKYKADYLALGSFYKSNLNQMQEKQILKF